MLLYEPLSKENLEEATQLVRLAFPNDVDHEDNPALAYKASLDPEKYSDWMKKHSLKQLGYLIVRDKTSGRMVGLTGWYTRTIDVPNVIWLGWYCVAPEERGRGLGRTILEWTMDQVREKGFTVMRLYTTTDPNEAAAQKLYEKMGFKIVGEEKERESAYKILFRERTL